MHPSTLADFLDSEAGAALRASFHERALANGALFRQEEDADQIVLVKQGRLRVYLADPERELTLVYLNEGDVFSTHTRAHLQAVRPSLLLLAPRKIIERELGHYPALQAAVIRVLATVLNQTMTLLEDLTFHQVRGRIARYLLRCAKTQKAPIEPGSLIRLDLNVEELAALLGTTRQTASTELNAMIHAGAIARQGRKHFKLCLPERLLNWASEEPTSAI
ncbi:Crp/Fnr family transcriptional regulator [Beijerinckia indica]|uniref:Transcriptional regulator, Crp/Fnr family n=1 Tax=Beijerinckia indica subsp. indica (strain ATCC 9039 / DSM 1715 / NCIMB 8712) TaxID=395963 RepID=B2IFA3_BEII9|nr:Crp/Fnr family transcriptional regulator [Beijerinckia indica]ACB95668.1 transcriptional regulator, Crp/Fnr family [Beijerinckia indica subsp. indica ATCC 9039]